MIAALVGNWKINRSAAERLPEGRVSDEHDGEEGMLLVGVIVPPSSMGFASEFMRLRFPRPGFGGGGPSGLFGGAVAFAASSRSVFWRSATRLPQKQSYEEAGEANPNLFGVLSF